MIGDYIKVSMDAEPSMPGPEDFVGWPINQNLISSAKAAIASLEQMAEHWGEYRVTFLPEGGTIKHYYGRSLEALKRVGQIRQLFAGNGYPLT